MGSANAQGSGTGEGRQSARGSQVRTQMRSGACAWAVTDRTVSRSTPLRCGVRFNLTYGKSLPRGSLTVSGFGALRSTMAAQLRHGSRAAVFGAWLQVLIAVVTGIDAKSRTCAMSGVLSCCSLCDRGRSHGDTANEAYGRGRGLSTHFVVVPRTHVNKHPQLRGVSDAHVIRALWHHGGYITVHTDDSGQPHRRVVQHHARGHSTLHRQPQIFMLQHGS